MLSKAHLTSHSRISEGIFLTQESSPNLLHWQVDSLPSDPHESVLECEFKWALESITMNKASEGDGIPVELFQILKDDAVKVLHSICQQIWRTQQWPQDWKRSVFIPIPKKGNAKECSGHAGKEGPHLEMTVASRGFSRAAAPGWGVS